jgi:putative hydrolase of the HAD superfamily
VGVAQLALFDLDNTLIDRNAAYRLWAEEFAADRGLAPDAVDQLVALDGDGFTPREEVFGQARERFGLADPVEDLIDAYHRRYPHHLSFPAASLSGLRALRAAGWKVGIVTNGLRFQQQKLEAARLVDEVDGVCISDLVGSWKPDPGIFLEAARRCGAELAGWMVGDSGPADIRGGQGVGLRTIWLTRGRRWELGDPEPDACVDTVAEAVEVILSDGAPPRDGR